MDDHKHEWSKVGLWETDTKIIAPCLSLDCPAALLKEPGGKSDGEVLENKTSTFDVKLAKENNIAKVVLIEIEQDYKLDEIKFYPGDVVIDIGAHIGLVSIQLAIANPNIIIYAFEPVSENYLELMQNIALNKVTNVIPVNLAVTGDGQPIELYIDLQANSGGSSTYVKRHETGKAITVKSTTLTEIFCKYGIERCRLLKIDCEGAEYNILNSMSFADLRKIDILRGEFHANETIRQSFGEAEDHRDFIAQHIKDVDIDICEIANNANT